MSLTFLWVHKEGESFFHARIVECQFVGDQTSNRLQSLTTDRQHRLISYLTVISIVMAKNVL